MFYMFLSKQRSVRGFNMNSQLAMIFEIHRSEESWMIWRFARFLQVSLDISIESQIIAHVPIDARVFGWFTMENLLKREVSLPHIREYRIFGVLGISEQRVSIMRHVWTFLDRRGLYSVYEWVVELYKLTPLEYLICVQWRGIWSVSWSSKLRSNMTHFQK